MAAGVPVVSTALGAEGLEARHGEDILIADSPETMLAAVAALHDDPALHQKLAHAGLRLAASKYDWAIPGGRLFSIYEDLARSHP